MTDMRKLISIVENRRREILPATPANIGRAKRFVLDKWRERAIERGHEEPNDLSSACKFCSLFAAMLFGGEVCGHWYHQWCELPDGRVIDLAGDAQDVASLSKGEYPDYLQSYSKVAGHGLPPIPRTVYARDDNFMRSKDARESNHSVKARVAQWVDDFKNTENSG